MTLEEALSNKEIPQEIRDTLALITVPYVSFAGKREEGHLVIHTELTYEVQEIFAALYGKEFPIEKIIPVAAYGWDDEASMKDNNTSAFNYRMIAGTDRLSHHAYGRAIDINPVQNPYVGTTGKVTPEGASYTLDVPGTITRTVADLFLSRGWEWGGEWSDRKDWQHFQKPAP